MSEGCKVTIGYASGGRGEDITDTLDGETIFVTLSDGTRVGIEPFEREPGFINIVCDGMVCQPRASNVLSIGGRKFPA